MTRLWRCGNRGNVACVLIEKPARGDFLPIVDGGFSLQYSPLDGVPRRQGHGAVLPDGRDGTDRDRPGGRTAGPEHHQLRRRAGSRPPSRQALYVGDPAGKSHLEKAGVSVGPYEGGKLSPDQVLIVGPGGGQQLAAHAAAIAEWLKAGGHLLAIGLDQADVKRAACPRSP